MNYQNGIALVLCIILRSFQSSINFTYPIFPIEAHAWGFGSILVGSLIGTFGIVAFLTLFMIPKFASQSNEKRLYIVGGIGSGISVASFGLAHYSANSILFVSISFVPCILFALFGSLVLGCAYSIATNISPELRIEITNALQFFQAFGSAIGPIFGGVLYSLYGYSLTFIIPGILYIILTLLFMISIWKLDQSCNSCNSSEVLENSSIVRFAKNSHAIMVAIPVFISGIQMGLRNTSFSTYASEKYGYTPDEMSYIFSARPISYIVFSFLHAFLTKKGYSQFMLCYSILIFTFQSTMFYITDPFPAMGTKAYFSIVLVVNGYACSFVNAPFHCLLEWISKSKDLTYANRLLIGSWYAIILLIGNVLGCVLFGGFLVEMVGFPFTNLICTVFNALSFVSLFAFMLRHSYFSIFTNCAQ